MTQTRTELGSDLRGVGDSERHPRLSLDSPMLLFLAPGQHHAPPPFTSRVTQGAFHLRVLTPVIEWGDSKFRGPAGSMDALEFQPG